MQNAKTIEIFLPDGEPTGTKVAHIHNRVMVATYIPRARLESALKREALQGVGVYFLFGSSEEHSKHIAYIGEAESISTRLQQHNKTKDFWNYAIAFTSNNGHLTKTHAKYLEWFSLSKAQEINRYIIENSNVPSKPHVQEATEAALHDNFKDISLLLSTLGISLFTALQENSRKNPLNNVSSKDNDKNENDQLFHLKSKGLEACGRYTEEGFVVFKGATIDKRTEYKQLEIRIKLQLIKDGLLEDNGKYYILKQDFLFNSPSQAAFVVLGRSANGWTSWKTVDGKTLHDIYRK